MKLTVTQPVSPVKPTDLDGLIYWQTREASPFESQVRTFTNAREFVQKTGTTNGLGAFLQLYQEDMPFTSVWAVDAYFLGRCLNGANDFVRVTASALFKRINGAVPVQQGAATTVLSVFSAGFAWDISVSGNGVQVLFSDAGTGITNVSAVICIQEVL